MGLSIIYVVMYHLYGFHEAKDNLSLFQYGYMGVDVFMFLSGYGLCYSFARNDLPTFYKRRLARIYPLWILKALIVMFLGFAIGTNCTLWDAFCNLTTLYYLGIGGTIHDWYIPAILIIYLMFPFLYHLISRCRKICLLLLVCLNMFIFAILHFFCFNWFYDCFIARIPMVLIGVATYHCKDDKFFLLKAMFLQTLFLIPSLLYGVSGIYSSICWAPILMFVMIAVAQLIKTQQWLYAATNWVGNHTLEIYLAHSFNFALIPEISKIYPLNFSTLLLEYFIITIVMSLLFIRVEKFYKRIYNLLMSYSWNETTQ